MLHVRDRLRSAFLKLFFSPDTKLSERHTLNFTQDQEIENCTVGASRLELGSDYAGQEILEDGS